MNIFTPELQTIYAKIVVALNFIYCYYCIKKDLTDG